MHIFCPCLESEIEKASRHDREECDDDLIIVKEVNTIKKKRQGMFKMGQDDVRIRLSVDEKTITYTMCEGGKMKEIFIEDCLGCEMKRGSSKTFCIFARNKDLLLEGESSTDDYAASFVAAISYLCKSSSGKSKSGESKEGEEAMLLLLLLILKYASRSERWS
jgi:hypothetical protein